MVVAGLALGRRHPARLAAAVVLAAALLPGTSPALPRPADVAAAASSPAVAVAAPVRLRVPAAGVDAAVPATGVDGAGALVVPADPAVAGWHAGGPAPGGQGPAVLAGHVDWAGRPTVFARLDRLVPGDEVLVDRADGTTVRFVVTAVDRYAKDAFPTTAVYGATPGPELRLITCGGAFDRVAGSYEDNLVVSARAG
ncbi:class F sortase [Blastococcus sp. TF02A-30]|nr:class F sortase [Blastococcus sp. TF02A-30]